MKKVIILLGIAAVGYFMFGKSSTDDTAGTPIVPQPPKADSLEGKAVKVADSIALYLVKNGQLFGYSSPEAYAATGSPEIVTILQSELDAFGGSPGGIDGKGNLFNY